MFFARCRSFLARHRRLYWLIVISISAVLMAIALDERQRLDQARRSWSEPVTVWVATEPLAPGKAVLAEPRQLPRAALPDGASTIDPAGSVALRPLQRNEVVTDDDIGDGAEGLAPAGSRVVAIPADDATLTVAIGDRVDVIAAGIVVAADGVVVAVGAASVAVAVDERSAPAAASAAHDGLAVLVTHATAAAAAG